LAFPWKGRFPFASNQGNGTTSVIDIISRQIIKTIPVGDSPHFLALEPDGPGR
jgi:YVTN family beta-propeller protein